jgi:DNA gyrase subunit A
VKPGALVLSKTRLSPPPSPEQFPAVPSRQRKSTRRTTPSRNPAPVPPRTSVILDTPVVEELRTSFMSYALSVIVARALPDARDGLKPVHRRILFSLYSQNIKPTGPYKKSARVVGDTMARYHPHGDSAIYESLVRLAQDFSMRVPLVDPHGNFGSLDDSPAASRYTECRLAEAGLSLLDLLDEDTVDFVENYDGTEKEPSVLPSAFPNLLVNGSTGVAVGMATNIPPHNLAEVAAAAAFLLRNKNATIADVLRLVPGPDFPSGGEIIDPGSLKDMYLTGRGTFTLRAKATIIDLPNRRKGIAVTELPYTVGPEKVIARIRELIGEKKLPGLADARDLSDRVTGLRLVFEVKNGHDPLQLLAELYRLTPMQENFAASFVALVDGRPRVCSLFDLLKCYVDHRLDVLRRSTKYRLDRANSRAHLLAGLVSALDDIDAVVSLIRSSKDTDSARTKLMKHLSIDEPQANYVLDMPLRRLTSLEVSKVRDELAVLYKEIKSLKSLLGSDKLLAEHAAASIESASARFTTARRTALTASHTSLPTAPTSSTEEFLLPEQTVRIAATVAGSLGIFHDPLGRAKPTAHDLATHVLEASTRDSVHALSASGLLSSVQVSDLQPLPRGSKGISIAAQTDPTSPLVALLPSRVPLLLATRKGLVKRLAPDQARTGKVITLADDDALVAAVACPDDDSSVIIVSRTGQVLRFPLASVRPQQRPAAGVAGIRLADDDEVLAVFCVANSALDQVLWLLTSAGNLKGSALSEFPAKGRATGGVRSGRFLSGETHLLAVALAPIQAFTAAHLPLDLPATSRRDAAATRPTTPAATLAHLRP